MKLPASLQQLAHQRWQQFQQQAPQAARQLALLGETTNRLQYTWAHSEFVFNQCLSQPELIQNLYQSGQLEAKQLNYSHLLKQQLIDIDNEAELMQRLRQFRNRYLVRIIYQDLNKLAKLTNTMADLSALADSCVQAALGFLYKQLTPVCGTPYIDQKPQQLIVFALGKLGAKELNLSSDIDLIFAYPKSGNTEGGRRSLTNQEFFTRLGQGLIKVLDQVTADGFVFRVDMRLRPYGQSGALVYSNAAMLSYYQEQGRPWERYAWIKARVIAGDFNAGQQLIDQLTPFIYRRYLDFGSIESLRQIKALINREVARQGSQQDIKLGWGGIRELEFIIQASQLIYGGRYPLLQCTSLLKVLDLLFQQRKLDPQQHQQLIQAYGFLRDTEHRLQAIADQQTQTLPQDSLNQIRLAYSMGYANWPAFNKALDQQRQQVNDLFRQVFAESKCPHTTNAQHQTALDWWLGQFLPDPPPPVWQNLGFNDSSQQALAQLAQSYGVRAADSLGRERLDKLMPLLLLTVSQAHQPDTTLAAILPIIAATARRSAYFSLLTENQAALQQLVKLCSASIWLAQQLADQPLLLDQLLDPRTLLQPLDQHALAKELNEQLAVLASQDLEQQMDCLRRFKLAHQLRVAAADILGVLPLMEVSNHLSALAEVLLEQTLALAWQQLSQRYGYPTNSQGPILTPPFIIVAYGKLGGVELGYNSDLDLVFLHQTPINLMTQGDKPISNDGFFLKLGQRINHLLSTHTQAGLVYPVDMRLRPSGRAGLLVSTLQAFTNYQQSEAWTWEHQALVRARVVAGDKQLAQAFQQTRQQVLSQPRQIQQLRQEVVTMRNKMHAEHKAPTSTNMTGPASFDLKHSQGAIIDIEFLVQYAVLAWAKDHPQLLAWTDNIRIIDSLVISNVIDKADGDALQQAYLAYRAALHRFALQQQPGQDNPQHWRQHYQAITSLWQRWLTIEEYM
jgi:glutamate-ammonia-ligase adenylyltransferase